MKERGTFLVPTMYIGDYFLEEHPESEAQKKSNELSLKYREDFFRNIGAAIRAIVKVAVGVDLGHYGHDPKVYTREFGTLVEAGMSPMERSKRVLGSGRSFSGGTIVSGVTGVSGRSSPESSRTSSLSTAILSTTSPRSRTCVSSCSAAASFEALASQISSD